MCRWLTEGDGWHYTGKCLTFIVCKKSYPMVVCELELACKVFLKASPRKQIAEIPSRWFVIPSTWPRIAVSKLFLISCDLTGRQKFWNPAFCSDGMKLYPMLIIQGTGLYKLWKMGRYQNYTSDSTGCLDGAYISTRTTVDPLVLHSTGYSGQCRCRTWQFTQTHLTQITGRMEWYLFGYLYNRSGDETHSCGCTTWSSQIDLLRLHCKWWMGNLQFLKMCR